MKIGEGEKLRAAAWKKKGNPSCDHPGVDLERHERGEHTGDYVCPTCGLSGLDKEELKGKRAPGGGTYI